MPYCSQDCFTSALEAQGRERLAQWTAKYVPTLYRDTLIDRLPRADIARALFHSFDWDSGRGAFLKGASGSGKTRTAYEVLKQSVTEGATARVTSGGTFQHQVIERTRPGGEGNLHGWLEPLTSCDVLLFDEVEKMSFSKRVETEFFGLFNTRVENGLATIFSSNATLTELCSRMSRDTGPAVIRRVKEFCDPYDFDASERLEVPTAEPRTVNITSILARQKRKEIERERKVLKEAQG